ncbi:fasciclin-like arabinogalactan protein 4 [Glycine max]|uniref:fasciclin-like arabinogalactan protein 4 n=1 Tax=Glycine max TaxID=3847 RepID=UPI0003DEBBBA|nr:fasciclin-like arabinogalactan protein 4 [Glycine max]|eukprot:XP_006588004.1 fasciclin-like arabinogalactan protein 4 [Glycine max]
MPSPSRYGFGISQITLRLMMLLFLFFARAASGLNLTALLSTVPELSQFTSLLASATPLAADLSDRSSLSILAVPNAYLAADDHLSRHHLSPAALADVLRYHVLLQFLSWSDLRALPPSGKLITTLLQTTGRATDNFGSVNLTRDSQSGVISIRSPRTYSPSNATSSPLVEKWLLWPPGHGYHNFNVAASMLAASGVEQEFEADEGGAGITLFVPVDDAFADLPPSVALQSLPADKKAVVLKFHVLHSYYPLGSLESVVNPFQPTLATEAMGAGSFTLNISRVNGSVAINTGIVQASITQTVFDQNPVAIFGVSKVLLPREIFGKNPTVSTKPLDNAPPPDDDALSPENSPGFDGQPSHLSSPPGFREDVRSHAGGAGGSLNFVVLLCCIGLYFVV